MLAQEIDCQDIDSGPTLPAMDSPCAPRGLDALNEKRRVARTAASNWPDKLPWGAASRGGRWWKKEAECHRRLQVDFCLRSLGGPRFRSLLRLAADRKFRVVGKRSPWHVKLDRVSRMASKMSTAFMAESPGADQETMTQAIENVMTHGPCNDTWIRCHERLAGPRRRHVRVGCRRRPRGCNPLRRRGLPDRRRGLPDRRRGLPDARDCGALRCALRGVARASARLRVRLFSGRVSGIDQRLARLFCGRVSVIEPLAIVGKTNVIRPHRSILGTRRATV